MKAKLALKPIDEPRTTTTTNTSTAAVLKKKEAVPECKAYGSKPTSTTTAPPSAAQAARPTAAPAAAVEPVKRAGLFGMFKKNITPATTTAPGTTAAHSVLSTAGGLFSPSSASAQQPRSAPAMVDSIIKSAKADSTAVKTSPSDATTDGSKSALGGSGGKVAGTPGAPLNNAFASKSLISNIVNNYNNAVSKTTPVSSVATPAHATKPVATTAPSTTSTSTSVLRDITPSGTAPASAVKATPSTPSATTVTTTDTTITVVTEYIIEDRDDSDEEGSGTDNEKEEVDENGVKIEKFDENGVKIEKKEKQNVPDWARGPLLKEALERQYGMGGQVPVDPDLIFPEVTTCSLEEIFGAREAFTRKYGNRSSSAHWDADQMTLVEKRVYRKHMGYDRGQPSAALGAK